MSNDNTNVLGLVREDFEVDNDTSRITAAPETYEKYRPEEITSALEASVDKYRTDYIGSVVTVAGEIAIDEMLKDKDDTVTIDAQMGSKSASVSAVISHTKSGQVGDKKYESHGAMVIRTKATLVNNKAGVINKAQKNIRSLAKKKLS